MPQAQAFGGRAFGRCLIEARRGLTNVHKLGVIHEKSTRYRSYAQAALTVNAHPPQIRTHTEPNHYALAYSAQDFQSVDTVKSLHERIVRTAKQFCPTHRLVGSISRVNDCVSDVVDDLVGKIERPSLDAYVRGETEVRIAELIRNSRSA